MPDTPNDEPDVLQFAGATEGRDKTNDHVAFQLADDDYVYHAHRPKMTVLLRMATALTDDSDMLGQASAFDQLLDRFLDAESVAHLRERLDDPDDELDLDAPGIANMFQSLVGLWYGRPTRKPRGSRGSSPTTGPRSTAR